MATIRFLTPGVQPITVSTPLDLEVSWGDRVSRLHEGPAVYGSFAGLPYGTPGDLRVQVGHDFFWDAGPATIRASRDGYGASGDVTPEQRDAAIETHRLVGEAWRAAIAARPEVAAAVEDYRRILDQIDRQHDRHAAQWRDDAKTIARMFRRARVEIGEQTVPGKVCVRSSRGRLLGYANVWDGVWQGTIERV